MEGVEWVLVHKDDSPRLYIRCSFSKVGTKAKLSGGRAVWEFTEDFTNATGFSGHTDLANKIKKHRIPINIVKLKPYTNAASEWHQRPITL